MPAPEAPGSQPPITAGRTLDHAARLYDWLSPLMMLGQDRAACRDVVARLSLAGTERVLDLGCGTGALTRAIAARLTVPTALAVGLDAAPRMVAVARRNARRRTHLRFDVGVAERLPYPAVSFDCAVSTFFFHHVNYDLKLLALNELARVLRPGARAIVVDLDVPTTAWGRLAGWSAFRFLGQPEIRENLEGRLRAAFAQSRFRSWRAVSHQAGYISGFELMN